MLINLLIDFPQKKSTKTHRLNALIEQKFLISHPANPKAEIFEKEGQFTYIVLDKFF